MFMLYLCFTLIVTTQKPQCWFGRRTLYKVYTRELDGELFTESISTYICCNIGPCYDYASSALKSMLLPYVLLLIHHKVTMLYPCALMSYLSYTSSPVQKQCPHGETTSKPYKPAFHSSHLSCNMSHGGAATLQIFCLPQQRYSYSTQSSITELLLLVS